MLLTSLAAFLSAFSQQPSRPGVSPADPPGPFGYELRLERGEALLRYAWDGGPPVPFLAPAAEVHIPFGEHGASPLARLYLPGNSAAEIGATGASFLARAELTAPPGRFGPGLGFGPRSYLRVVLPPQAPEASGWTLAFWLRPEDGAFGRTLVRLPGALEVALQNDGRLRAHLLPSGEQVLHPGPLARDTWSSVVVAYDPRFTRQLRLVVDRVAANTSFAAPAPARVAAELEAGDLLRNGQGFVGVLDEIVLEALPQSTGQAQRASERPEAGPHRLELVTSAGLREVLPVVEPSRAPVLDDAAEFERGELDGVVVQDGALRWTPARWRELATLGAPPPRTTHPTVSLDAGRVFTFGGETRDTHLGPMSNTDDTWIYSPAGNSWERVATSLAPSPRCHVPAAYSPDHDLVLLVGGWKNDTTPTESYGDTWVFHGSERRWEQRFPSGDPAPRGSDFGLVYLPALGRFLLLLGARTWLYDPVADSWQARPPASAVGADGLPTSFTFKGSAMCALDPATGLVLVFGGHYGPMASLFSDETALYDVGTNTYTVLAPPVRPSARVRSGFAYDSRRGHFVLFGGVQDQFSQRHDDLWIFDPRTRRWSELPCSRRPSPRGGFYGMAYDEANDRFVLFGGRNDVQRWLDETHVLELRARSVGTALYTFDRVEQRGRSQWFADATTPGDSSVGFLFRASRSGSTWGDWGPAPSHHPEMRFVQAVAFLRPGSAGEVPVIHRMGLR